MVVDCFLRTDIEPAECGKDPRFALYRWLPNMPRDMSWSAPVMGVNCEGKGGHAVHGAPEPFGLGISLARCEGACEAYTNSNAAPRERRQLHRHHRLQAVQQLVRARARAKLP